MFLLIPCAGLIGLAIAITTVQPAGVTHAQEIDHTAASPASLGVLPLDVNTCPSTHPIKGNKAGRQANRPVDPIYHVPGSRHYDATDPEECFATPADAETAGYRAPLR
jgi:hypothetical protein